MKNLYDNDYININGNEVHRTAIIGDNVIIGKGNVIMPYAVIGERGFIRDAKTKGEVIIGNNNKIGCYVAVMSGADNLTSIGNNNLIMNYVNIGHNAKVGNDNEIGAGTVVGGHAEIGNRIQIKLHCLIRNRIKIGDGITIGMGTNVVKSIDEKKVYYGNPAK